MGNKIKKNRRVFKALALGILFWSLCLGIAGITVKAEEQAFTIDAQMLPSNRSAYEIRLTVENQGEDWEGTVRLMFEGKIYNSASNCAYDTFLSLPSGSTKQFVIKVPKESMEHTDGIAKVTLLDKNGNKAAQKEFDRLLQAQEDALLMGILSDSYLSLTYLDMGGYEIFYKSQLYPIKLVELDQDNLADTLDALSFLVIDSYNTSVLSDKALESIEQWLKQGGVLIVGTGERANEVLSGLDNLDIECSEFQESEEDVYVSYAYLDISQLQMVKLIDSNGEYIEEFGILAMARSYGDGAVGILPYSLSELGGLDQDVYEVYTQEEFVENVLWQVSDYSILHYGGSDKYNYIYDGKIRLNRFCNLLGNGSSRLQFGGLKIIVILYVIFVGPVLYLILRFLKKQDLYWIAVPVATLAGIFLVYVAGRGFEVTGTNVFSVTIENLSGGGNAQTYMRCYDAGHKEWDLRLAEGYEYVGPLEDDYYGYYGRSDSEKYYYHIKKEGDGLFFGITPSGSFEDSYFLAGITREPEKGRISGDLKTDGHYGNVEGTVINETERDFKYFAVIVDAHMFVYKNLPAGAEINLEEVEKVFDDVNGYYDGPDSYFYNFMRDVQRGDRKKDADILTALGMGVSYLYSLNNLDKTAVIGVCEDWDKVVDDNCNEVSYGCLYSIY